MILIFNLSWFLVYAIIMKVKNNITPQNEQNLFCIGRGLPLPHPHLYLMVAETLEGVHSIRKWEFLTFFYKSKVIEDNHICSFLVLYSLFIFMEIISNIQ